MNYRSGYGASVMTAMTVAQNVMPGFLRNEVTWRTVQRIHVPEVGCRKRREVTAPPPERQSRIRVGSIGTIPKAEHPSRKGRGSVQQASPPRQGGCRQSSRQDACAVLSYRDFSDTETRRKGESAW